MKRNLITILLLLSYLSFAQINFYGWREGEIYLNNSDTLKGQILIKTRKSNRLSNTEKVAFREGRSKKRIKLTNQEIAGIRIFDDINGDHDYLYLEIKKGKSALFELVEKGEINLFYRKILQGYSMSMGASGQFQSDGVMTGYEYYISIPKLSSVYCLLDNRGLYLKDHKEVFKDCNKVFNNIENNYYDYTTLEDLVEEYNACF